MTSIEELDKSLAQLRERVAELAASQQILADDTVRTRANLQQRMDVLESFLGQAIDHLQDHARSAEAHEDPDQP